MDEFSMLALDMGASNGRVIHGVLKDGAFRLKVIYRFENEPVTANGTLYWDILRLFHEIKKGMLICGEKGLSYETVGLCSWGNTVGLLDKDGGLIMNPYHYRDTNPDKVLKRLYGNIGPEEMFGKTWYKPMTIQPTVFLNYLREYKRDIYDSTETVLMISDLFNYFLTGIKASEKTMAATSQMVNMETGLWDGEYMTRLGLREDLFPDIRENGSVLGKLSNWIGEELGLGTLPEVIAVSGHDTASASGCIDAEDMEKSLYLSCGTWSCMGCRVGSPIKEDSLYRNGITNDYGLYSDMNLRSNHTGLWILQECKREWAKEGKRYCWADIIGMAQDSRPFIASIDTEAEEFFLRNEMPEKVREYCERTGQSVPITDGETARVILESLAMRYRFAKEKMEESAGCDFKELHMISGGSQNSLLCQYSADVLGIKVIAGPAEASALGNFVQQAIAKGRIKDMREGREIINASEEQKEYLPVDTEVWDKKYKEALSIHRW